jgi:hypothetical protein
MLGCLNNQIAISRRVNNSPIEVSAYLLEAGGAKDIFDRDLDLVDMNELDSVSEEISAEYIGALNE